MKKFIQFLCLTALTLASTMHAMDSQDQLGQQLIDAASRGKLELVQQLLAQGAEVDAKDHFGFTPLDCAALKGHEAVCGLLIANGATVNPKDNSEWTPLIWAARNGHETLCRLLLAQGAAVDAKDNDGSTPLSWAARNGHEAVCQLLINTMLQPIQDSKAKIVALLGIKRFRESECLNIIGRDGTELIARQMYAPAALQLRNLFDQINAIPDINRGTLESQLELQQRLLAYARRQLRFETKMNGE